MAISKEEREARKRKAALNELRKGPDLEKYLEGRRRKYTTYAQGAKAYLEKMAEYKPLAKVEEIVEQNYNMIDNVINNTKPPEEPQREEQKKQLKARQSLRQRLEDKKRLIAQLPVPQAEKAQIKKLPDVREP